MTKHLCREFALRLLRLQFPSPTDDNRIVPSTSFYQDPQTVSPFRPGALVIATLTNPREKFWGAILHLSAEGLSLRGVDVASFDDLASQIKSGEPFTSGVVFFPCTAWSAWNWIFPKATSSRSPSASPRRPDRIPPRFW
jgi:hypothetical protein